jgi:hypothetical protein
MQLVIALIAVLVAVLVGGSLVVASGYYNVAATSPESGLTRWFFRTTMRRSVAMHSSGIAIPKDFTVEQVRAGFNEFHAMCAGCHGLQERRAAPSALGCGPNRLISLGQSPNGKTPICSGS